MSRGGKLAAFNSLSEMPLQKAPSFLREVAPFNSLFEMHELKRVLERAYWISFNSLFEMPRARPRPRAGSALRLPFNSLFEMRRGLRDSPSLRK